MPSCSSPGPNKYNKYDPINGEYSCETCPSINDMISDIQSSPPFVGNLESNREKEEMFRQYIQIGANSNDSTIRNKYGDLLINLYQCENYSQYGIDTSGSESARESAVSEITVDLGTWEVLDNIQSLDDLSICDSSDRELNRDETRICEIINFYKQSDGYLSGSALNSQISRQFGNPNQVSNNNSIDLTEVIFIDSIDAGTRLPPAGTIK